MATIRINDFIKYKLYLNKIQKWDDIIFCINTLVSFDEKETFEDTKWVISAPKSKTEKQYEGQTKTAQNIKD